MPPFTESGSDGSGEEHDLSDQHRRGVHHLPRRQRPRFFRTAVSAPVLILALIATVFSIASAAPQMMKAGKQTNAGSSATSATPTTGGTSSAAGNTGASGKPTTTAGSAPANAGDPAANDPAPDEPVKGDKPNKPKPGVTPPNPQQPNPNCTLAVPANPLTAAGLATPYQLTATDQGNGACHESNADQAAFVEATIIDPATGALSVYRPLVIDKGTQPAAAPVVPTLPANAVVGVWFGFNGTTLTLRGENGGAAPAQCVNGLGNSPFGQFAHCNAPAFFAAANAAIGKGQLTVPAPGTAKDGMPCPTTRDFSLVDQDQSDNVVTSYLITGNRTAQNNTANAAALGKAKPLLNGSDNLLLNANVNPALGCKSFTAPDLTDNGKPVSSLALDELVATAHQAAPIALVPTNNPMTQVDGKPSTQKTNLMRAGVGQPALDPAKDTPKAYCRNLVDVGSSRIQLDKNLTKNAASPDKAAANNLFTFLAQRLNGSFTNLGCQDLLGIGNPVTLNTNAGGVVTDATFAKTR